MTIEKQITQTVCGGKIKEPEKYPTAEYHGKRIYFCNNACLRAFAQNPDAFMAGEVEHPSEDEE